MCSCSTELNKLLLRDGNRGMWWWKGSGIFKLKILRNNWAWMWWIVRGIKMWMKLKIKDSAVRWGPTRMFRYENKNTTPSLRIERNCVKLRQRYGKKRNPCKMMYACMYVLFDTGYLLYKKKESSSSLTSESSGCRFRRSSNDWALIMTGMNTSMLQRSDAFIENHIFIPLPLLFHTRQAVKEERVPFVSTTFYFHPNNTNLGWVNPYHKKYK